MVKVMRESEASQMKQPMAHFALRFFLIFGLGSLALAVLDFNFLNIGIAQLTAQFMGLEFAGNTLIVQGHAVAVTNYCNGLTSGIVLAAVVFGLKGRSLQEKIKQFVPGLFLVEILNLLRVTAVLWAGKSFGMPALELAHIASWFLLSAGILGYWFWTTPKKQICKKL